MPFLTKTTRKIRVFLKSIGPGLVTGSSDDDPSGIATYSQAGAQFGLRTLWTALITFPLMAAVQEMCARIGLVTSQGLTHTLKKHYPKWILWMMISFSFPAIIFNIGADIAGMGAAAHLLFPAISAAWLSIVFTALILVTVILFPYQRVAAILKWLCLSLLVYLIVPLFTKVDWSAVLHATLIPYITWDSEYLMGLVAILGTTISPYLFFWQATMEAEDLKQRGGKIIVDKRVIRKMREDVDTGMLFSNVVMFFIILTCGSVLFPHGVRSISLSYMLAESFDWQEGLDKPFFQARPFYGVIVISLLMGLALNFTGINPVKGLIYSAILYGMTAPVLIAVILHIGNNRSVMGGDVNGKWSNILGGLTLVLMLIAALGLLYFLISS
ncbi:divalent metal cation transporter [Mucilaginibacter conchicola]|uniref:Divalent metal cation transporter n=1 Tax=Mucilaginibacter conchicola TaxID=2303333 RepID=A0A372NMV5_9SPHI|nr:divalent metal cation transporter [Mucilaginibacter conchicola]RFZ89960.1 divalent metal cation transporter [Mucilaginibacter conchicola]